MNYTKDQLAVILLDSMIGLEYKHKKFILDNLSSPSEMFSDREKFKALVIKAVGEAKANTVLLSTENGYPEYILERYAARGTKAVTYLSDEYPDALKNIGAPPLVLYCNGDTGLLGKDKKFAIVGSRKCLPDICALTKDFASVLSNAGATIVTGSAGGADSAAIEGAILTGRLISVIAGGIDHVYPDYNKRLIERVERSALVVSEHAPDCEVRPWMFPVRNRIIAGMTEGVLITGGKMDSGARHTATFAVEGGKDVFAFPYSIGVKMGELNNHLIKSGAYLCDDVADILSYLDLSAQKQEETQLDETQSLILGLIKSGVDSVDMLVENTGLKAFELAPHLAEMEVSGLIVKLAGNTYKAKK